MHRYELNVEDMADIEHVLRSAINAEWPDAVYRQRYRDLEERFRKAHVVYIETEDTQL